MKKNNNLFILSLFSLIACSPEILPVGKTRIASAQRARSPIPRGKDAPGAFSLVFDFRTAGGFLFDPTKFLISESGVKLKPSQADGFRVAVLQTSKNNPYSSLHGFIETLGPSKAGLTGEIRYQISNDGNQWHYFDGKKWALAPANSSHTNLASEVNSAINHFDIEVGTGNLFVKIFFLSKLKTDDAELKQLEIKGVSPPTDTFF